MVAMLAIAFGGPLPATADGLNYSVPEDYYAMPLSVSLPADVLFARAWFRELGGAIHVVLATVRPAPDSAVFDEAAFRRERRAEKVVRAEYSGCSGPGVRLSYTTPDGRLHEHVSALAAGRVASVTYSRPPAAVADPQAMASLATLCSGIHQAFGPPSWTRDDRWNANTSVWKAADGSDLHLHGQIEPQDAALHDIENVVFPGRILRDTRDRCGEVTVRHVVSSDASTTFESVRGYLRGFSYSSWYRRPAGAPADAEVVPVLTSFCATPAPVSDQQLGG
jgi:hypothetical protein